MYLDVGLVISVTSSGSPKTFLTSVSVEFNDIDLTFSIKDRTFLNDAGRENFPDGEIYCSPVENSANGWVKFSYPGIHGGREVEDVELWFENGRIIKERASKR